MRLSAARIRTINRAVPTYSRQDFRGEKPAFNIPAAQSPCTHIVFVPAAKL